MKNFVKVLSVAVSIFVFLSIDSSNCTKYTSAEEKLSNLKEQQIQLNKQQDELNSQLKTLKNNVSQKRKYKKSLLDQLTVIQKQIDIEAEKIAILNDQINYNQANIENIQKDIDNDMDMLRRRLNAIYKYGEAVELEIILKVKSFEDFIETADLIQKLSKKDSELIDELKNNIVEIQQEKDSLNHNKSEAEQSKANLENKRQEINTLQNENEKLINELQYEKSDVISRINENNSKQRNLENIISVKNKNTSITTNNLKKGRYIWPVPGYSRISSGWGDGRNHNGIDIPAPKGTKVVAMADGVVAKANSSNSWGSGWGYHVKINHGDGYETLYAHLSQVLVQPGQKVSAGQVIGLIGNTGYSFGNHLHCGTSKNGSWYNPKNEI